MNDNDREIKQITIEFDSGAPVTVTKGFIMEMHESEIEGTVDCTFHMANMRGEDMKNMIYALAQFVSKFMPQTEVEI